MAQFVYNKIESSKNRSYLAMNNWEHLELDEERVRNKNEAVKKAMELSNDEEFLDMSATHMTELLTDSNWTTWNMFQDLASDYLLGTDEIKRGIDIACSALTGWYFCTIAEQLVEKYEELQKEKEDTLEN